MDQPAWAAIPDLRGPDHRPELSGGDVQWLPGYCVLLADDPAVGQLSDLPRDARNRFLAAMADLGEAVEEACREHDSAFRRVNLEILGNTDAYLHAHVWPRYDWEPPDLVGHAVWRYPHRRWTDPVTALGPQHDGLRRAIARRLTTPGETGW